MYLWNIGPIYGLNRLCCILLNDINSAPVICVTKACSMETALCEHLVQLYIFHLTNIWSLLLFQLTAIWRWIPQRATMGTPQLVYASYNDGFSLSTFYAKSEPYEPTVLIVKTTQQEVSRVWWNEPTFECNNTKIFDNCRYLGPTVQPRGHSAVWKTREGAVRYILVAEKLFSSHFHGQRMISKKTAEKAWWFTPGF